MEDIFFKDDDFKYDDEDLLELAMRNTYDLIIGKFSLEEIIDLAKFDLFLCCDPHNPTIKDIKNLLKFYENKEEYEMCSDILKVLYDLKSNQG